MNETNQKNEAAETAKRQQGLETGFENSDGLDFELEQALKNFKSSMHAWSEAAYSRPRSVAPTLRQRSWRLAAGWALGCVLVAGSVSGGLVQRHHRVEAARVAAEQRAAEQQRQLLEQRAQARISDAKITDEVLLAGVDSDVSRQVPSAMEPLAQMMQDDEVK
jgi:hypothetical protein